MIRDYSRIDTTPGAVGENSMFSPPAEFHGERREYLAWLKTREQEIRFMAWIFTGPNRCTHLEVLGPHAEAFQAAFDRVCSQANNDRTAFKRSAVRGA